MVRDAISKRLRFEVFKRDGFKCTYCGDHPPNVLLEADHVIPVAKDGPTTIDNLTTACLPCNRGKGAVPLSSIPESLKDRAERIAEAEAQLSGWTAIMAQKRARIGSDAWVVLKELLGRDEVPRGWFISTKRFVESLGLPAVLEAVDVALSRCSASASDDGVFRYFCGVCWNFIRNEDSAA